MPVAPNLAQPVIPTLARLPPALRTALAHLAAAPNGGAKLAHSLRVMARVRGALARTVAALHDVLETTPLALDDLRRLGFSDAV
ncbi:MAG: hypothetical protein N2652_07260, partial [Kiritimatiellae bacterium]|nr:hypothetical protein [Kiritimatiellia bacterium]